MVPLLSLNSLVSPRLPFQFGVDKLGRPGAGGRGRRGGAAISSCVAVNGGPAPRCALAGPPQVCEPRRLSQPPVLPWGRRKGSVLRGRGGGGGCNLSRKQSGTHRMTYVYLTPLLQVPAGSSPAASDAVGDLTPPVAGELPCTCHLTWLIHTWHRAAFGFAPRSRQPDGPPCSRGEGSSCGAGRCGAGCGGVRHFRRNRLTQGKERE